MAIQTLFNSRSPIAGADDIENFAMANCLMILSSQQQNAALSAANTTAEISGRMFTCKTCGRKFSSFQALGGHRASHKKIKTPSSLNSGEDSEEKTPSPVKPKTHACTICGLEFPIGQALGGHMRRHRPLNHVSNGSSITTDGLSTEKSDGNNHNNTEESKKRKIVEDLVTVPFLKKSSSCKRVCLDLDLNLSWPSNTKIEQEVVVDHHDSDLEEGEIVEQEKEEEERDFLKLELRQPINWAV